MPITHFCKKKGNKGIEASVNRNKYNKLRDIGIVETSKEKKEQ